MLPTNVPVLLAQFTLAIGKLNQVCMFRIRCRAAAA
jgi:hypothetical protein